MREHILMMKDGRVMIMRDGDMLPMEEEVTMPDGTQITVDGRVILPDGSSRMMMEGESIDLEGQMVDAADMSDRQFTEAMEDEELRDDME
jgi:hypothetical protein